MCLKFKFDSNKFYDWCMKMSKNNIVFVSEYKKPRNNFKLILNIKNKLTGISPSQKKSKRKSKKREEKLFKFLFFNIFYINK